MRSGSSDCMQVIQMAKRRITHIKIEHKIAHIKIVHIKIEQMHTSRSHTSRSNINKLAPRRRANAGIGSKHIKIKHKRAFRRRANAHIKIRKCTLVFCHDRIEISSVDLLAQLFRSVAVAPGSRWGVGRWASGTCLIILHPRCRQLMGPTQQTRPRSLRIPCCIPRSLGPPFSLCSVGVCSFCAASLGNGFQAFLAQSAL